MKKFVLVMIFALALSSSAVFSETLLQGEIGYNVNSARDEVSTPIVKKLTIDLISQKLYDSEYGRNHSYLLNGNLELKDRTLALFSDLSYAVMYKADEYHVWYYTKSGMLMYAEEKDGLTYPYRSYKYDTSGNLINKGLRVSKAETFIFKPNGKLIAHWVGANGYDEVGNVIMTRKYLE
jgi:hypothetical protein